MQPQIGKNGYFEGISKNMVGEIVSFDPIRKEVKLKNASWIADSGRFGEFIRTGKTENIEVEFCGDAEVCIQYSLYIDFPHPLFTEDK